MSFTTLFGSKPNSAIRKRTSLLTPKPDVPTMTQFNFYGRKSELQTLSAFYANASTNLGVIYGRRRVGKSLLIKESLKRSGLPFIYLECKQTSEENNLRQLMSLLGLKLGIPPLAVDNFEDAIDFLFKFCKSDATVLVFDEYPFLRDLIPGFDSILQALVDRYKGESKLQIILCGSYIDIMKGILAYKSPLYGRSSFVMNLHPMDYYESAEFYGSYSNEDKIKIYSALGGIPYYNSLIDPSISVEENFIRLFLLPEAILSNEVTLFLAAEVSKVNNANLVLEALGQGARKYSDIATYTKLPASSLASVLNQLGSLDLISKDYPINAPDNLKKAQYVFRDNMVHFYYKYIYKNISHMGFMNPEKFYDLFIGPDLDTKHIPKQFEGICREFLIRSNKLNRITPPFFKIGRYYYDIPKLKKNGEFDVVTEDQTGFTFYEVKCRNQPMTPAQIEAEIEQVNASPLKAIRYGFISKSGFKKAEYRNDLVLYDLNDLYADELRG